MSIAKYRIIARNSNYAVRAWHRKEDPKKELHYQVVEFYKHNGKTETCLIREGQPGARGLATALAITAEMATKKKWWAAVEKGEWTIQSWVKYQGVLLNRITAKLLAQAKSEIKKV